MTDIASLGIKVSTQGVTQSTKELEQLQKQGDKAAATAQKIGNEWGKKLGGLIATGLGVGITGIGLYIKNTIEAEEVQAQLAARIRSTGQAAGLALDDLNKMSKALEFKTSFDDEDIGRVQALLLTFTKIGKDTFPRATEKWTPQKQTLPGSSSLLKVLETQP